MIYDHKQHFFDDADLEKYFKDSGFHILATQLDYFDEYYPWNSNPQNGRNIDHYGTDQISVDEKRRYLELLTKNTQAKVGWYRLILVGKK
jgi:hypothetical protein